MKRLNFYLLSAICYLLSVGAAGAVCPVCTIAVGAGLEGMRLMGVDDVLAGIWAGGLILSLVFWTAGWIHRRGLKSAWWYLLDFAVYYSLLYCIYLLPSVHFGAETLWGIDKFLLGTLVGSVAFWLGAKWYANIKRQNGGKAKFAFQKVVMPLLTLAIATVIFWIII